MFDWALAHASIGALLHGLVLTVVYALAIEAIVLVGAIPVGLARTSASKPIKVIVNTYIGIFRSTPLLIQLIYIYFALPALGIRFSPAVAGIIGLSLHYIAYIAEVYRSGLQAVPIGQREAAMSLGMPTRALYVKVIFPQAFRMILPTLGNYFVSLLKDTSLLSAITVTELLFTGQLIAARTYDYYTLYTMVFVVYLVLGVTASVGVRLLEKRLTRKRLAARPVRVSKESATVGALS